MPFTLAHPAAVLPIHSRFKKWISLPSLVMGSLVPDAAYYLPMPDRYKENAHTWLGAFSFSLPVGIVVLVVFYCVTRDIVFLLPRPHREALQPKLRISALSPREALMDVCGIVIGAETHVLWDSLTHARGWLAAGLPMLGRPLMGHRLSVDLVLEILSSILGVWVLLHVYDRWITSQAEHPWAWRGASWRFYLWLAIFTCCVGEAMMESDTVHAVMSLSFLRTGHFGLILVTSFVRDVLFSLCIVAVAAKILRLQHRHPHS